MPDDGSAQSGSVWPLPKFRLGVKWGDAVMSFQEVPGLDVESQPFECRHGDSKQCSVVKMPGPKKYGDVTMSKKVDAADKAGCRGSTDITLNYIVPMSDLVARSKKALRERLGRSETVKGHRRVALQESFVPVLLLRPPSSLPAWSPSPPVLELGDDLAYMNWNYRGVALWELPGQAARDKEQFKSVRKNFDSAERRLPGLCAVVCANRLWLRLLLQALVVALAASIVLCAVSRSALALPSRYEVGAWIAGGAALPLALVLQECDPALHEVRQSPRPLAVLAVVLVLATLRWRARARPAQPRRQ